MRMNCNVRKMLLARC